MEKIKASEGMYLTQKSVENEGARVFAISLYLADNDSRENWREATKEEYYEWQQRQETEVEEQQARAQEAATNNCGRIAYERQGEGTVAHT